MASPLTALGVSTPILAAPMAGGPSTPALVTAAARANGLGFLAGGYKTRETLAEHIAKVRFEGVSFGVNLFAPNPIQVDPEAFRRYAGAIAPEAQAYDIDVLAAGIVEDDDHWSDKIDLLLSDPVPVVSFTFAIPEAPVIAALRAAGTLVIQTVTSPAEARLAAEAGADMLAVQASAAGGHSATLTPQHIPASIPLTDLLGQVRQAVSLPLIAAGGLATPTAVSGATACRSRSGHGRHRPAACGRGRYLATLQGRTGRSGTTPDRSDPGVHRPTRKGTAQRLHRPLHQPRSSRLSRAAPPDQPDAQGRRCRGRS
jgi:nitronate monooxygenase